MNAKTKTAKTATAVRYTTEQANELIGGLLSANETALAALLAIDEKTLSGDALDNHKREKDTLAYKLKYGSTLRAIAANEKGLNVINRFNVDIAKVHATPKYAYEKIVKTLRALASGTTLSTFMPKNSTVGLFVQMMDKDGSALIRANGRMSAGLNYAARMEQLDGSRKAGTYNAQARTSLVCLEAFGFIRRDEMDTNKFYMNELPEDFRACVTR